jgi:hypothetical protein
MIGDKHSLTQGYVYRHVSPNLQIDIEISILDIAQDFLLSYFDELIFF